MYGPVSARLRHARMIVVPVSNGWQLSDLISEHNMFNLADAIGSPAHRASAIDAVKLYLCLIIL